MNLQTLQDQRKAEFEKEFPNAIHSDLTVSGLTSRYNSKNDIQSFLSETARLGYELGQQSNIEGWKDTNKDAYHRGKIVGLEEASKKVYKQGEYDAYIKVNTFLSSLITTNQEKV